MPDIFLLFVPFGWTVDFSSIQSRYNQLENRWNIRISGFSIIFGHFSACLIYILCLDRGVSKTVGISQRSPISFRRYQGGLQKHIGIFSSVSWHILANFLYISLQDACLCYWDYCIENVKQKIGKLLQVLLIFITALILSLFWLLIYLWFLKSGRLFFFFMGKTYQGLSLEIFRGGRDLFWSLNCPEHSEGQFWAQKGRGPPKKSQEMTHYLFCPRQKRTLHP